MSKLNLDLPILLIDTSYWLYYRFFSLRNWYFRAYPEKYIYIMIKIVLMPIIIGLKMKYL